MSKRIPTDKYYWFENDQVFVLWNWVWVEDDNREDNEDHESRDGNEMNDGASGNEDQSTDADNKDDEDNVDKEEDSNDGIPAITHCVVFKCIYRMHKRVPLPRSAYKCQ